MQLTLKKIGQDDYAVMAGNRCAGRIMRKPKAFGVAVWFWTITGLYAPAQLLPSDGEAESLENAKAAFKAKWQALHDWAEKSGLEPRWIGDH